MSGVVEIESLRQLVVETNYCRLVSNLDELRSLTHLLRTRGNDKRSDFDISSLPISYTVNKYLDNVNPTSTGWCTPTDETGHSVLFLLLLAPLARDRSRKLALMDEAAQGKPLLVSILLPEFGFNLSELESAYEFSVAAVLDEQFGEVAEHVILHDNVIYIDKTAMFYVLAQQHPSLLIALAYSTVMKDSRETLMVREILKSITEGIEGCDAAALIKECREQIENILCPDDSPHNDEWYLYHTMKEAFDMILFEEQAAIADYSSHMANEEMEVDEQPNQKALKKIRRRLTRLRRALPGEI